MDAELLGGPGEVPAGLGQDPADEAALELAPPVLEMNSACNHLVDQAIQQFLHGLLGRPAGLRYARLAGAEAPAYVRGSSA